MIVCPEIEQKQPHDRNTISETLSRPVAKILSPVARQAPTKSIPKPGILKSGIPKIGILKTGILKHGDSRDGK